MSRLSMPTAKGLRQATAGGSCLRPGVSVANCAPRAQLQGGRGRFGETHGTVWLRQRRESNHLVVSCAGRGRSLATADFTTAEDIHVNVDILTTPNEDAVKLVPGCDVTGQVCECS